MSEYTCLNCGHDSSHVYVTWPADRETGYSDAGYVCDECTCTAPEYADDADNTPYEIRISERRFGFLGFLCALLFIALATVTLMYLS